jgi:hypothetical protein
LQEIAIRIKEWNRARLLFDLIPTAGDIATEFQRNRAPPSKRRQRSDPEFAKACALTPNRCCCRAVAKIGSDAGLI